MEATGSKIAIFATSVEYADLPESIIDYAKILILDSVVCGIGAASMERSTMLHRLLDRWSGRPDATVFGMRGHLPAPLAAAANAEIMNLLDADDLFRGHFAVINAAVGLAESQRTGASGREMIRAFTLGWEVNARLAVLQPPGCSVLQDGQIEWRNAPGGISFAATGAAVTAAVLLGLDAARLAHSLNLSAWKVPTPTHIDFKRQERWSSLKYANYFDITQAAMMSAYLAEGGYVSDGAALDSPFSHLRMVGIEPDAAKFDIPRDETQWLLNKSALKLYPACRFLAPLIDLLSNLVANVNVDIDDIKEVAVSLHPAANSMAVCHQEARHLDVDHRLPLALSFNVRYLLALVLLKIPPGPAWFSNSLVTSERVQHLMAKIRPYVDEGAMQDLRHEREAKLPYRIALRLNGGAVFERSTDTCLGNPDRPDTRMTWPMLRSKMNHFCGDRLDQAGIDRIYESFRNLEEVIDMRQLQVEYELGCQANV